MFNGTTFLLGRQWRKSKNIPAFIEFTISGDAELQTNIYKCTKYFKREIQDAMGNSNKGS